MKKLIISAGGKNTRIKEYLADHFSGIPKHILPLPNYNTTVLEKIVRDALGFFEEILITTNENNHRFIKNLFTYHRNVSVAIDQISNGPLGPMFRELIEKKDRVYACAGDFFANFSWKIFEQVHFEKSPGISILVSNSNPTKNGARFVLNHQTDLVQSWERVEKTTATDLINIGCYIVEPKEDIIESIKKMTAAKEDNFFDEFIKISKIAGYNPGGMNFNINTPENYDAVCQFIQGI